MAPASVSQRRSPVHSARRTKASISADETTYLLETVRRYFARPVSEADIRWTYAGIRPLYDDKSSNASAVTRDYVLDLDAGEGRAPMLSIFGGKITTYRKLAEHALQELAPFFPDAGKPWTADAPLLRRLARAYGTRVDRLLGEAQTVEDLGQPFGGDLHQAEVDYLVANEWARTAEDILYRRSKLGLHTPPGTAAALEAYLANASRQTA